jgi:hypothetical protein
MTEAAAAALCEPINFGFTDDVETLSSVVYGRAARPLPQETVRLTPPAYVGPPSPSDPRVYRAPTDQIGAFTRDTSAARSESVFTSVTDRLPRDGTHHAGRYSPLRRLSSPTAATVTPAEVRWDNRYRHQRPHGGDPPVDTWCQTSDAPEALSREERMAAAAQTREEWEEGFKRRWLSVSTHYSRMIQRAERCSPGRIRGASAQRLHHLHPVPTVHTAQSGSTAVVAGDDDEVDEATQWLPPMYRAKKQPKAPATSPRAMLNDDYRSNSDYLHWASERFGTQAVAAAFSPQPSGQAGLRQPASRRSISPSFVDDYYRPL